MIFEFGYALAVTSSGFSGFSLKLKDYSIEFGNPVPQAGDLQ